MKLPYSPGLLSLKVVRVDSKLSNNSKQIHVKLTYSGGILVVRIDLKLLCTIVFPTDLKLLKHIQFM